MKKYRVKVFFGTCDVQYLTVRVDKGAMLGLQYGFTRAKDEGHLFCAEWEAQATVDFIGVFLREHVPGSQLLVEPDGSTVIPASHVGLTLTVNDEALNKLREYEANRLVGVDCDLVFD